MFGNPRLREHVNFTPTDRLFGNAHDSFAVLVNIILKSDHGIHSTISKALYRKEHSKKL